MHPPHGISSQTPASGLPSYQSRASTPGVNTPPPFYSAQMPAGLTDALINLDLRSQLSAVPGEHSKINPSEAAAIWKQTIALFKPLLSQDSSGLRSYFSKLGFTQVQADYTGSLFEEIVRHERPLADQSLILNNPTPPPWFANYASAAPAGNKPQDGFTQALTNALETQAAAQSRGDGLSRGMIG